MSLNNVQRQNSDHPLAESQGTLKSLGNPLSDGQIKWCEAFSFMAQVSETRMSSNNYGRDIFPQSFPQSNRIQIKTSSFIIFMIFYVDSNTAGSESER